MVNIGEKFQSSFTGREYVVKRIIGNWALMETENGVFQILTELKSLGLFYNKIEPNELGELQNRLKGS